MMTLQPFTVHEAEIAVFHAWGDGLPVGGPLPRFLIAAVDDEFRVGLKMAQVEVGGGMVADFSEWRKHRPERVQTCDWMVEVSSPFGAAGDAAGVRVSSFLRPGMPVVVVVRFVCADTGLWRLFQFHDCVVLPSEVDVKDQTMFRGVSFSAGHMEEFKSGAAPLLVPRLRGVVEWRHLGRCVRCWEYDAEADVWTEDAENSEVVDGETVRHVSLDFSGGDVALSYLAARTEDAVAGGLPATGIGWIDAITLTVSASSGLILAPGWVVEAAGCAEPLMMQASGRHWEHPRVVFRFLGRTYATIEAGVFALPALSEEDAGRPMDFPIRLGALALYPEGGWLTV